MRPVYVFVNDYSYKKCVSVKPAHARGGVCVCMCWSRKVCTAMVDQGPPAKKSRDCVMAVSLDRTITHYAHEIDTGFQSTCSDCLGPKQSNRLKTYA